MIEKLKQRQKFCLCFLLKKIMFKKVVYFKPKGKKMKSAKSDLTKIKADLEAKTIFQNCSLIYFVKVEENILK